MAWNADAYAGFWRRALGHLVDMVLYGLVAAAVFAGVGLAVDGGLDLEAATAATAATAAAAGGLVLFYAVYDIAMTRKLGWTLGKRAVGLEVRGSDGELASVGRLLGRWFARALSGLPLLLGYLWAGWDPRKQTWHDHLAGTVVLKTDELRAPGEGPPPRPSFFDEELPVADPSAARRPPATPILGEPPAAEPPPAASMPQEAPAQTREPLASPAPESSGVPAAPLPPPVFATVPEAPPRADPNGVAVQRAGLDPEASQWLRQVVEQVDPRLDRVHAGWRSSAQAEAARACAFGLLLAHLARLYPHMRPDLSRVAEAHPSFTTLPEGGRLTTLEEIAEAPDRVVAWVGPLIDVTDQERMTALFS